MRYDGWDGRDFGREVMRAAMRAGFGGPGFAGMGGFGGGHGFRGWGDDGEGRSGGRGRRVFQGGDLRIVLLKLIADEPRHGYELIREIEAMSNGAYAPSPGVIYPTLTMLAEEGLIEEQAADGAKKRYAITAEGRAALDDQSARAEALLERLRRLGGERERTHGAPIQRAMANLGMAVKQRLGRGEFSEDTLHDVAALIDEVAQKIERLR